MTNWSGLVAVPRPDFDPFDIGGVSEIKQRLGLDEAVKLHWNENLFGPLPGVLDAAQAALGEAWMYPEDAYQDFRGAVAAYAGTSRDRVFPGHGAQSLIGTVATTFLWPGEVVVVAAPTYYLYGRASEARGARVQAVPLRDLRVDVEELAATARRARARLVWICDPNNPTGDVLRAEEWEHLLDHVPPTCVVVVDEAYVDYLAPAARAPHLASVEAGRPLVVLRSFSKFFGLAGLRLGYALADEEVVSSFALVEEPYNVNCVALAAGRACVEAGDAIERRRDEVARAREVLSEGLRRAGAEPLPAAANFVLARLPVDDLAFSDALARRGILVRPGSELGLPRFVRITVGPEPLMQRVAGAIAEAIAELARASAPASASTEELGGRSG